MTMRKLQFIIDSRTISPGEVCGDEAPVSSENSFLKQRAYSNTHCIIYLFRQNTYFNKATEAFLNSSEIILSGIFCLFLKFLDRGIKGIASRISRGQLKKNIMVMKKKPCVVSNDLGFSNGNSSWCNTILQNFMGKSFALSKMSKGK